MRLRWTVPAADDLQNIKNYLQQNYPQFLYPFGGIHHGGTEDTEILGFGFTVIPMSRSH